MALNQRGANSFKCELLMLQCEGWVRENWLGPGRLGGEAGRPGRLVKKIVVQGDYWAREAK